MPSGLYVHVPFCSRKCPYCDFYSVSELHLVPAWLEGIGREAALAARGLDGEASGAMAIGEPTPILAGGGFDTLYLGGGSPSLLSGEDLRALLGALVPLLGPPSLRSPLKEATIEANPEDAASEKARIWKDLGLTRVSLGIQSFEAKFLGGILGRTHSPADNFRALEIASSSGLDISLDLIYGHPGQRARDWAEDLDKAASSSAGHVSAYMLTASPGTPLGKAVAEGSVKLPDENLMGELFEAAGEALGLKGLRRYEVSNYARPGSECLHNLKYWRREPYLGLGPAAHSFDGIRRFANVSSLRRWISALARGERALALDEAITQEMARMESVMLGLRMAEGFAKSLVKGSERLEGLAREGFLIDSGDRISPTSKGLLAADALARILA